MTADLVTESNLTRAVRTVLRNLKTDIFDNVSISVSAEYDGSETNQTTTGVLIALLDPDTGLPLDTFVAGNLDKTWNPSPTGQIHDVHIEPVPGSSWEADVIIECSYDVRESPLALTGALQVAWSRDVLPPNAEHLIPYPEPRPGVAGGPVPVP